jgi:tetratricopeptide (TPR) repeat protein
VGETPNLAARLQGIAAPNTVIIAEGTRRLLGNLFELQDLGPKNLKGLAGPARAWVVLRARSVESRFEALHATRLTDLVGREEELELLLRRWARAKTGEGQVVLIAGEAGIGKSRLTAALLENLAGEPHTRLRYFCSPHHQDSALYPSIVQLERAAGFRREDTSEQRLEKLEAVLAQGTNDLSEAVPLLADLLSIPTGDRYRPLNLTPQKRKERTLQVQLVQVEGLAARQPVLMVFEDVHWSDPTTRESLDLLIDRVATLPVLVILTFRPEFAPPWIGRPHVTLFTLSRLPPRQRIEMIAHVTGGKALPKEITDQIVDRTDGVPLFIEELTKSVVESGIVTDAGDRYAVVAPVTPLAIPTSLHASLLSRLDRLAPTREIAQIGAALGRSFSHELISAVAQIPQAQIDDALAQLAAAELIFRRGTPPDAVYTFKHALVQDAAYSTLLRNRRQQLHARILAALESQFPELVTAQPERLARHCVEAGLNEKAVGYWLKAGQQSVARSAMVEAAAQLQKGLDQLALLSDSAERKRQGLELRSSLGWALVAVRGEAAPESGQNFARARELWEELDCPSEFLGIPFAQSIHHTTRGELDLALRLDDDLLRLSRRRNDVAGLVLGHFSAGRTLMLAGRFASCRLHLEEVFTLDDPISHRALGHYTGVHPHVGSGGYLGMALLCLGFPDRALIQGETAIAVARRLAHPLSLAAGLVISTRILALLGGNAALQKRADELVALAAEQGFSQWREEGMIYRGWIKVKNGDVVEGLSLLRSGSTAFRATGAVMYMPYHMALLARGCEIATQNDEASTLLDDAVQIVERTGERWLQAELYRHKGQLLLRQGHAEAAEELYCKALSTAEEQEAKLWELRAATSLARLWRDQGKVRQARELLAPVYGWFTEGFDTRDLAEAKALLNALGDQSI